MQATSNEATTQLKKDYEAKGFLIVDTGLSESVLDGVREDLAAFFGPNRKHLKHVPYADKGRA